MSVSNLRRRIQRFFNGPRRRGQIWCDQHWRIVYDSWLTDDPIDPVLAVVGFTVAFRMWDIPEGPVRHACCAFDNYTLTGILRRSRVQGGQLYERAANRSDNERKRIAESTKKERLREERIGRNRSRNGSRG